MKNEGNEMSQALLNINGKILPRGTVMKLTTAEINPRVEIEKRKRFDDDIFKLFGNSNTVNSSPIAPDLDVKSDTHPVDDPDLILPEEDPVLPDGTAVFESPFSDMLINAEVLLPQGEEMTKAIVKRRTKTLNGNEVGTWDKKSFTKFHLI